MFLEVVVGEYRLDIAVEPKIVNVVRVSGRLVVIFQLRQLGLLKLELAQIERSTEVCLQHPAAASLVVVTCPFVYAHTFTEHLYTIGPAINQSIN